MRDARPIIVAYARCTCETVYLFEEKLQVIRVDSRLDT